MMKKSFPLSLILSWCIAVFLLPAWSANPLAKCLDAPVANDDFFISPANTAVTLDVLSNDTGDMPLAVALTMLPQQGNAVINANGTIQYTPVANFVGSDSFVYSITDAADQTATATVFLNIEGQPGSDNLPPNVVTFSTCTAPFTPVTICYPFSDPNGDPVHIDENETETTFNCSLNFLNDTCFRYTPLPGFFGTDTVHVVVCDNQTPSLCSVSKITVYVGCVSPEAHDDQVALSSEGITINGQFIAAEQPHNGVGIPVINNDEGFCNNDITISSIVSPPTHGVLSLSSGQIIYDPAEGYVGLDSFTYQICNDCGLCDQATVSVNVQQNTNTNCDHDLNICVSPFSAFDICPEFCLENTISVAALPSVGSVLSISEGCFSFVPPANFSTVYTILFIGCNSVGVCDTTTAHVTLDAGCGNIPPIAQDDNATVTLGTTTNIDVLANDTDPEGMPLTPLILVPPTCGTAFVAGNQIAYTAAADCVAATDSIVYQVCDPVGLCSQATVHISLLDDCSNDLYYCTQSLTPVVICVNFCSLEGSEGLTITDASTTFDCSITLLDDHCLQYIPLPGFFGTDVLEITGCNDAGECEVVAVNVTTGCAQPIAGDDAYPVPNTNLQTLSVLGNDIEPCDNALSVTITQSPQHGIAYVNSDGTIAYTANANYQGADVIVYKACSLCNDGTLKCDEATVSLNINTVQNTPLNVQPDVVETLQNTPIAIAVLNNDSGSGISVSSVTLPTNGTATISGNNIQYTPNNGYVGTDYFFYTACLPNNNCQQTIVAVTVLPTDSNFPPTANNDIAVLAGEVTLSIPVLYNDSDPENQPLTLSNIPDMPDHGTAAIAPNGTISYTPHPDFDGVDFFTYTVCDPQGNCSEATVAVVVGNAAPPNNAPIAQNDEVEIAPNNTIVISLLDNDTDPENTDLSTTNNQILTVTTITEPLHGSAVLSPIVPGDVTYLPNNNYEGPDYFAYVVCDSGVPQLCDTAYVIVIVGTDNLPPVAQDDVLSVSNLMPTVLPVLQNDNGNDDPLSSHTINITVQPQYGTVQVSNNQLTYTPQVGYLGGDTFTYQICDAEGLCDSAIVTLTVVEGVDAQPDLAFTMQGELVSIALTANDLGTNITLNQVIELPENGSIQDADPETGVVTYLPNANFVGTDYFTYEICNPAGFCDITVVAITVAPADSPNTAPTAGNDVVQIATSTPIDIPVLDNDSDPQNDMLSITQITVPPTQGTATINPNGTITYTPNGNAPYTDTFTYEVCDNGSPVLCTTAQVAISIGGVAVNLPPIAVDDSTSTTEGISVIIPVLENGDTDVDGTINTLALGSQPAHGTAEVVNQTIVYSPVQEYIGNDFLTYIICDSGSPVLCDTAYVQINILPLNFVEAETDMVTTAINTPIEIEVLNNDEGTQLAVENIVNSPENGTVSINPIEGTITYEPSNGFVGTDYFEYQVCNPIDICDITVVVIHVVDPQTEMNLPPIGGNDIDTTSVNTPINMSVLANDTDPNIGDMLILQTISNAPDNGTAVIVNENGQQYIVYTPNAGFIGEDNFQYVICDNAPMALCDTVSVVVSVGTGMFSNQPPIATDDFMSTEVDLPVSISILDNDTDVDGDALVISYLTDPANGNLVQQGDSVTYSPNSGFTGTDYFAYVVCDTGNPSLCDTAYVTLVVEGEILTIYDTTAVNTSVQVCFPDYFGGFEIDTIIVTETPENAGLIIYDNTDCAQYVPNPNYTGIDSFMVSLCDTAAVCIPALVIITVGEVTTPQPPVANNDVATTSKDTPVEIPVLGNDYDPNDDEITAAILVAEFGPTVAGASVSYNPQTLTFTYSPGLNYVGIDSFAYIITDDTGLLSDTAWVFVNIQDIPMPTIVLANNDNETSENGEPIDIAVLTNDFLAPAELTTDTLVQLTQQPAHGDATVNSDFTITYTPDLGFVGVDTLVYEMCVTLTNNATLCDEATVVITVGGCPPINIANAFSPNGDEENDLFDIPGAASPCYAGSELQLQIFNRWGDIVYTAVNYRNDIDQQWNGNWQKNGEAVTPGTYFYILRAMNADSAAKHMTDHAGFIEVIR